MPDRSFKSGVTPHDLEIGVTYAGFDDTHESFGPVVGHRNIMQCELSAEEPECSHRLQMIVMLMLKCTTDEQLFVKEM